MVDSIRSAASSFAIDVGEWERFFNERVKAHKLLVKGYLSYLRDMEARNLPPIFENRHLGLLLGLQPAELTRYSYDPDTCYRTFEIPKRNGGVRVISTPWIKLLESQRWIDWNILRKLQVHEAAHGYVSGRSNITNAERHLGAPHILCMDVSDFFSSVDIGQVLEVFSRAGYPKNVSVTLSRLCTRFDCLPQGAPSSPQLSNVIMFIVDTALEEVCTRYGYRYTRYVDDITISGKDVSKSFSDEVSLVLDKLDLTLNPFKTRLQTGRKQIVTGISIGSGQMKLPRSMRRRFKNDAFLSMKRLGVGQSIAADADAIRLERQLGQLSYWKSVEPENRSVSAMFHALRKSIDGSDRSIEQDGEAQP